jgi:AcrR family transcriptional regulator
VGRQPGEIGRRRRKEIVEAAIAIIAEHGLPRLSLSAIEERAGMRRGQLMYYFPTKEDILLAVFDRLIEMMHERGRAGEDSPPCSGPAGWERLRGFLGCMLLEPPEAPEFHALQYTFLAQIGRRDDFRARLAALYEEWRGYLAGDFAGELGGENSSRVSARTLATFVQALLHGLAIQRVADPDSYDRQEMLTLCVELLGSYLGKHREGKPPGGPSNGSSRRARGK